MSVSSSPGHIHHGPIPSIINNNPSATIHALDPSRRHPPSPLQAPVIASHSSPGVLVTSTLTVFVTFVTCRVTVRTALPTTVADVTTAVLEEMVGAVTMLLLDGDVDVVMEDVEDPGSMLVLDVVPMLVDVEESSPETGDDDDEIETVAESEVVVEGMDGGEVVVVGATVELLESKDGDGVLESDVVETDETDVVAGIVVLEESVEDEDTEDATLLVLVDVVSVEDEEELADVQATVDVVSVAKDGDMVLESDVVETDETDVGAGIIVLEGTVEDEDTEGTTLLVLVDTVSLEEEKELAVVLTEAAVDEKSVELEMVEGSVLVVVKDVDVGTVAVVVGEVDVGAVELVDEVPL
ncbi:hypothetical protein HKX48_006803 [Thoreauomyces humboldtii]|nr:hypothetical protein HKX48_006803 [Thoreauomyces humboldtii]